MDGRSGQTGRSPNGGDRSVAELMRDLSQQTGALVQREMELAKAELREKGKSAGIGAGMFGGAGFFGLYAVGALTAAAILALAIVLDAWLAALLVGLVFAAIAGLLALTGRRKVEEATPPVPEEAVESTKRDVEYTKRRAQEVRR
jgi:hypothetical protein